MTVGVCFILRQVFNQVVHELHDDIVHRDPVALLGAVPLPLQNWITVTVPLKVLFFTMLGSEISCITCC